MATRRPVVLVDGRLKELPVGDAMPGVPGGALAATQVALDFGALPVTTKAFTIAAPAATAGKAVLMSPAPDSDEYEADALICAASCPSDGFITAYITATGPISGTRKFNYLLVSAPVALLQFGAFVVIQAVHEMRVLDLSAGMARITFV